MNTINKYYEHSGTIHPIGLVYMIIFGAIGALVLGFIYGYAMRYIPFVYLNILITLGFGYCVGLLVGIGGRLGKVRNPKVYLLFGFILGLFSEYTGWVAWIYAASKQNALILSPSDILKVIELVSENGSFHIFGWTPTGMVLFIFWGIEAIMITGMSTILAWATCSSTPFCERCNKWIQEEYSISPLEPIKNPDELKSQFGKDDFSLLMSLKKHDAETNSHTQISLLRCPNCQQDHFLTIISVLVDPDKKMHKNLMIDKLIISADNYRRIKEQW